MKSKSVIAAILLMGMSFTQVFAQKGGHHQSENKSPEEASKMMTEKLTKKLALTDDQIVPVQNVLLESFTQREEIQKKYPQLKQAKSEMKAIRKVYKEKKKSILTEGQREQLKASKKQSGQSKEKKGPDSKPKSPEQRVEKMKVKIELTASQEKELLEMYTERDKELKELKAKYPDWKKLKRR